MNMMFWDALLKELLHCHTPLLTTFTGTLPRIKAGVEDSVVEILVCRYGIWDLKGIMKQVENTGLDVDYRCVRCTEHRAILESPITR
jgi:hypothetical protein